MGAGDLSSGLLVERRGETLDEPSAVGEHDRRPVLGDQACDLGVDRRPHRAGRPPLVVHGVGPGHVFERDDDRDLELLVAGCIDDRDGTGLPVVAPEPGRLSLLIR